MEAKPRGRLRTNDPAGMRARILDAAAALFQTKGYHDSSVQDVKRAAGVSSGAFHHHFESKKALGLAVVKERDADAHEAAWLAPLAAAPSLAECVGAAIIRGVGQGRSDGDHTVFDLGVRAIPQQGHSSNREHHDDQYNGR